MYHRASLPIRNVGAVPPLSDADNQRCVAVSCAYKCLLVSCCCRSAFLFYYGEIRYVYFSIYFCFLFGIHIAIRPYKVSHSGISCPAVRGFYVHVICPWYICI